MRCTSVIAFAVLISALGCGRGHDAANRSGNDRQTTNRSSASQPITIEGCMQRGGGTLSTGFLLTRVNEPAASVGTSGNLTKSGSSIEREQLRFASETYRLDPKGRVNLSDMVGRQVRVTGTMAEAAKVPNGARDKGDVGTDESLRKRTQEINRDDPELHLDEDDLAKLDVTSASVLSDSCH